MLVGLFVCFLLWFFGIKQLKTVLAMKLIFYLNSFNTDFKQILKPCK